MIEQTAADWIARRNGGLSPADQAALDSWLAEDPRHAKAFAEMERTWANLNETRQTGRAEQMWAEIEVLRRRRVRRRRAAWTAAGAAVVAVLLFQRVYGPAARVPEPAAVAAPPALRILDDGSRIALRSGTNIAVEFDSAVRRVHLLNGEALFSVKKDPVRPFVVRSGRVEVRAVGTEFSVGTEPGSVTVLVTEGRISVSNASDPGDRKNASTVSVFAGDRVVVRDDATDRAPTVSAVTAAEVMRALAWRGERLEFSNTPLHEAVRKFNRRNDLHVVLADPELGQRTISGVLWADDSDSFVRLLEKSFDLQAEHDGRVVHLRKRR